MKNNNYSLSSGPDRDSCRLAAFALLTALLAVSLGAYAGAQNITFHNIAQDPGSGIDYARGRSGTFQAFADMQTASLDAPVNFGVLLPLPQMTAGLPGVAILDYDKDGDLDIYATNGPGAANSLFSNQLKETGWLHFIDVAQAAGVAARDQDSQGVCFGDIDNDGDHDLLVLGRSEANRLFENQGNGTFVRRPGSGIEGNARSSTSCSMGDINLDGLLDVFIGNSFDHSQTFAIFGIPPFALNEHNQLFLNQGGNVFADVSLASGVNNTVFPDAAHNGKPTITWAVAMVDIDHDGDIDIVHADDQGAFPAASMVGSALSGLDAVPAGIDRGVIHVFTNDGTGAFSDDPIPKAGAWMGLSFGDLNCDGYMDVFGSNFGDYAAATAGDPTVAPPKGFFASRWFLGEENGQFTDPGVGDLEATPFGWGTSIFDYDNDGDPDILFHGGLDTGFVLTTDNPGALLYNDNCTAAFAAHLDAFDKDEDGFSIHLRRNPRGVAVGDLDDDGYVDIVTVANIIAPASGFPDFFVSPVQDETLPGFFDPRGSVFDDTAFFLPKFFPNMIPPTEDALFTWTGENYDMGDLTVEINSGGGPYHNKSVTVRLLGSVGITELGRVNRDGIGAVVSFKPENGVRQMYPVKGGSSHSSQDSLELLFGLPQAKPPRLFGPLVSFRKRRNVLEVLWPGGVRNRLYDLRPGEGIVMPEIPCSFDADWQSARQYQGCVRQALQDLRRAGKIGFFAGPRLFSSAKRAFSEHRAGL